MNNTILSKIYVIRAIATQRFNAMHIKSFIFNPRTFRLIANNQND